MGWLDDAKMKENVSGISVPSLWGRDKQYGIDYPVGYKSEATADKSAAILERAEKIEQAELERKARQAPDLTKSSREKLIDLFNKKFGDPDTADSTAETAKIMEREENRIKESLGLNAWMKPSSMKPRTRLFYEKLRSEREGKIYERVEHRRRQIKAHKTAVLSHFDTQMEKHMARQQALTVAAIKAIKPTPTASKDYTEFAQNVTNHLMEQYIKPRKTTYEGLRPSQQTDLNIILSGVRNYMAAREKQEPGWWQSGHAWIEIQEYLAHLQAARRGK